MLIFAYQFKPLTKKQNTMNTQINALKLFVAVKTIKGTSFVGVKGYENTQGEISNQTFVVGINYLEMLKKDLETLKQFDTNTLKDKMDIEVLNQAKNELVESLEKRLLSEGEKAKLLSEGDTTMIRSKAQEDAYISLGKGLRLQGEDIYLFGLMVRKEVIKQGEYKEVKSRPLTIAKNMIKKNAELREVKFKNFKLGKAEELNLRGITIA
jgi:hypothetical protein